MYILLIFFHPHLPNYPSIAVDDYLKQTAGDLVELLKNPPDTTTMSLETGNTVRNALIKVATALSPQETQLSSTKNNVSVPRVDIPIIPTPVTSTSQTDDATFPRVELPTNKNSKDKRNTRRSNKKVSFNLAANQFHEHPTTIHNIRSAIEQIQTKFLPTDQTAGSSKTTFQSKETSFMSRAVEQLHINELATAHNNYIFHQANHIYDSSGKKIKIEHLLQGKQNMQGESKDVWNNGMCNELGRIAQGNSKGVTTQNCCEYIHHHEVPKHKKCTYANFIADYHPLKPEPFRIRLVVGGDKLDYMFDAGSPTTDMLETKILVNSVISDAKDSARFMSLDLKDLFLCSTMPEPEYMKIAWHYIP